MLYCETPPGVSEEEYVCTPVIADVPAALTDDLLTSDSVADMDIDNSASTRLDSEFFSKVTPHTLILRELVFFFK